MSANQVQIERRASLSPSEANTTITQAVANAQQAQTTAVIDTANPITEQQELQNLRQIISTWRDIETEVSVLNAELREKRKRMKALEEMVLRIMKKYNIGALDLKGSGGVSCIVVKRRKRP